MTMGMKLLAAALIAAMPGAIAAADKPSTSKIGAPAADFELTLVDGSKVRLADLKGQVVVLNFWATWCVPCRKELPLLDAYYNAQKEHGLRVFAMTTEDSVPLGAMKQLFAVMHIAPVRSYHGKYAPIGDAVPTNFVIDRAGNIRYAKAGAFDIDELNTVLVPLLREPAPTS